MNNEKTERIVDEVSRAVLGKRESIEIVLCAMLSGGHVLIEDIPGTGKTTLALALATAMGLDRRRVQFTPDVMPSDIVGFTMYQKELEKFVFHPGAVMCNLLLADEINRTSPKTQSALLEVMEEGFVTVDGVSHAVPEPFIVIATENPAGYTGTQMLPESQIDRFMVCVQLGYPDVETEIEIVRQWNGESRVKNVCQAIDRNELLAMRRDVQQVTIRDAVYRYIVQLGTATRSHAAIEQGMSPRGTIATATMAKARAYMSGREYVMPKDVTEVFPYVAAHRIRLSSEGKMNRQSTDTVIAAILESVEPPLPERKRFHG